MLGAQDGRFVLQFAGCRNDVISGNGDFHLVVTEFEREFAGAEELLMLPADIIGVGGQTRKPLGEEIDIGVVLREVIVAAATTDDRFLDDVEGPVNRESRSLSCRIVT